MSKHEYCPYCGIGISTWEVMTGFCQNCRTDIKEMLEEEDLLDNDEEDEDF